MEGTEKLARLFALQQQYEEMFRAYQTRGVEPRLDLNDKEFVNDAAWKVPHYFDAGADALRLCVQGLIAAGQQPPRSILDLPCGSGRVTRHLISFFPGVRVVASDLYEGHVAFCRDMLGAEGRLSKEDISSLDFGERFDLLFCGSLLTHLPERLTRAALRTFARLLSERGLAIVTLHGRHSPFIQHHKFQYVTNELFAVADATVPETGFGYVAYDHVFGAKFHRQSDYGVTLTFPRWILAALEDDVSIRVYGFEERGWDSHQDVLVFGRPGIHD